MKTFLVRNRLLFACIFLILIVRGVDVYLQPEKPSTATKQKQPVIVAHEFYPEYFFPAQVTASNKPLPREAVPKIGLVPHHLLASDNIALIVQAMATQSPKRVILVGPNHFVHDGKPVMTAAVSWQTHFGLLEADQEVTTKIAELPFSEFNEKVLSTEHSVTGLSHFITYFMPKATFVPIVLDFDATLEEVVTVADILEPYLKEEGTVLVGAVDFSHFLQTEDALIHSSEVMVLLEERNYSRLLSLDSNYTDSPESLVLMQILADRTYQPTFEQLDHYTSSRYVQNDYVETTSYVVGYWK